MITELRPGLWKYKHYGSDSPFTYTVLHKQTWTNDGYSWVENALNFDEWDLTSIDYGEDKNIPLELVLPMEFI